MGDVVKELEVSSKEVGRDEKDVSFGCGHLEGLPKTGRIPYFTTLVFLNIF